MANSRIRRLIAEVQDELEQLSGQPITEESPETSFFDQGLDSLLLTQAALALSKRFGVKLKLRDLAEEHPSCQLLATHLDGTLDPSLFQDEAPAAAPEAAAPAPAPQPTGQPVAMALPPMPPPGTASAAIPGDVGALIRSQLELMSYQLQVLTGNAAPAAPAMAPATAPAAPTADAPAAAATPTEEAAPKKEAPAAGEGKPARHGPQLVIDKKGSGGLSPTQEKHLARLVERYTAKTAGSKAFTSENRDHLADPRTVSGFTPQLKELVYPIVAKTSHGCHITDVDGNDYVDLLSGYGSNFFGYGADFVRDAVAAQMQEGMEIGPQNHLVAEVTELFRKLVPADRIAFCNTGSEAVLAALRMSRTATGRDLVVMFTGGYHGIFDEVVVRPTPKRSMPASPGIPRSAVDNMLVLPWAEDASLDIIRERADEIAAVLVEPVQSRAPHIQPVEFLKELRAITSEHGTALIFDEVVTGFRVAPGGAQSYFGIEADIASYGKVIGAGIPIGIVAGKREYLDALDGGHWQYGDASVPEVGVTYFAGTFVRHPLALAAAKAALEHMIEEGPELQDRVSQRTQEFADTLNGFFEEQNAPMRIRNFCSVMKVELTEKLPMGEIVFHHLRERGVHVWEGRPCFMTAAHHRGRHRQDRGERSRRLDPDDAR